MRCGFSYIKHSKAVRKIVADKAKNCLQKCQHNSLFLQICQHKNFRQQILTFVATNIKGSSNFRKKREKILAYEFT